MGFKVLGLKELDKALNQLPLKARSSVLRGALNKAATPILKAARAGAPKDTGLLRKRIIKQTSSARRSNDFTANVKVGWRKDAFYGMFFELGTSKQPAHPFLRPAFDANQGEALDIFRREMKKRIEAKRGG